MTIIPNAEPPPILDGGLSYRREEMKGDSYIISRKIGMPKCDIAY
jgi:hypothetical protein